MSEAILDSSAVLALLLAEPGAAIVEGVLPGALLSTVNFAEVITKLCDHGMPADDACTVVHAIGVNLVDYDADQASMTAELRQSTRRWGLSLGDRACLALARLRNLPAMTADAIWAKVTGADIVLIRPSVS